MNAKKRSPQSVVIFWNIPCPVTIVCKSVTPNNP